MAVGNQGRTRGDVEHNNRHRRETDAAGTDRRLVQVASAGDDRGTALPAQSVFPVVLRVVVVKLLMAMGYGGVAGHGTVTGKSGDGGIDGVIKQDKLGLDVVCIQAKRWDGAGGQAGHPGVRREHGLHPGQEGGHHDDLHVHEGALDFVDRIEGKKVVLIDGDQLADLMIEHDLGVTTTKTYELKEVSNDFFDESEG